MLLGCFEVAGRTVAIDVSQLREIVRWRPPTPLPGAPPLVEGVIDLRGALVPVVDLGRALAWIAGPGAPAEEPRQGRGAAAPRSRPRARIAVAEVEQMLVGLVVDAAQEIVAVDGRALGDPPPLALRGGREATRAVVRRMGATPIAVLDLETVLESVHRAALPAAAEERA